MLPFRCASFRKSGSYSVNRLGSPGSFEKHQVEGQKDYKYNHRQEAYLSILIFKKYWGTDQEKSSTAPPVWMKTTDPDLPMEPLAR